MAQIRARSGFERILAEGRRPVGAFVMSPDAATTAIYGTVGLDWVLIDREHGLIDSGAMLHHLRAAQAGGLIPIVRVLSNDSALIQQALDGGAQGVLVPKVGTAEQAARAVAATRYQPGGRGMCPVVPSAEFTFDGWAGYAQEMNENVILMPLIETMQGVENIEEIVAVDGVDYLFFGLADLSQDIGIDMAADADRLIELWTHVATVAHAHGVRVGAPLGYGFDELADFGSLDSDLGLFRSAAEALFTTYRKNEQPLATNREEAQS